MAKFESSSAISKGLGNALETISEVGSLPFIRGTWFFLDPYSGSDDADGRSIETAVKGIREAYDKCTDQAGDGICFLSRASATTADTTAYLGGNLAWAKHGITLYGACAGQGYNNRARIAGADRDYEQTTEISWTTTVMTDTDGGFLTAGFEVGDTILATATGATAITSLNKIAAVTASTITLTDAVTASPAITDCHISTHCRPLITVSGRNNRFINMAFVNGGTVATDDGAVYVSGPDNSFENCYFNGATSATVAAETTAYSVKVVASELLFKDCIFGTNATVYEAANAHIVLGNSTTAIGQVTFEHCKVFSCGADIARGAIMITNAATLGGWVLFDDCAFLNFTSNLRPAVGTTAIIGANPTGTGIALHNCGFFGYVAIGASNDGWYADNAAGAATGGLAATL
jgi:hypothetical protein